MRSRAAIICLSLGGVTFPAHEPFAKEKSDFPGIAVLMPADEFSRAGLHKLTPEEIQVLDAWLLRYTARGATIVRRTSAQVREIAEPVRIVARIKPPFTGWSGETSFELDNGQTWRQRLPGQYRFNGDNTEVVIRRNALGFHVMTLTATDRSIGVELVLHLPRAQP
ncbi:MAG: hypothetical protein FJ171_04110 [Gammaproteobacteria bacterium]|nr:hypothetical protein [Gammaproteobacteria bacterium]